MVAVSGAKADRQHAPLGQGRFGLNMVAVVGVTLGVMTDSTTRRSFAIALAGAGLATGRRTKAPVPYGVLPTLPQLRWSRLGFYNFLHFTVNTFTDKEWGEGDESPAIFNPTAFDPDAICAVLKEAGSAGLILTCKHHDGFCLWPTKTTDHSIRFSPYKKGQGDIVRELSDAAARAGLKFGVYLSPWDRNNAAYGTPAYLDIYRRQLRELLTEYGPIFEIWHDGANGGSGYYGGARETRTIDKAHYYDWPTTWALARKLQPDAVIFSDVGPDIRWVGNEKGIAGETCWATYSPVATNGGPAVPGDVREKESTVGTRHGKLWLPAECDVSIRPGLVLPRFGKRQGENRPAALRPLLRFHRTRRQFLTQRSARPTRSHLRDRCRFTPQVRAHHAHYVRPQSRLGRAHPRLQYARE